MTTATPARGQAGRPLVARVLLAQESGLVLVIVLMMAWLTLQGGTKPGTNTTLPLPAGIAAVQEPLADGVSVTTLSLPAGTGLLAQVAELLPKADGTPDLRVREGDAVADFEAARVRVTAGERPTLIVAPEVNRFLNVENLMLNLVYASFIAIMAVGMTAIIALGGIDLSVGSVYAVAALFGAIFMRYDWSQGFPAVSVGGSSWLWWALVGGGVAAIVLGMLASRVPRGGGGGGQGGGGSQGGGGGQGGGKAAASGSASSSGALRVLQHLSTIVLAVGAIALVVAFWRLALVVRDAGDMQSARSAIGWAVSVPLGVAVCCLVGAAAGLFNGVMIVGLRVHPFIITLGTMAALRGLVAIPTQAQSVGSFPDSFTRDFFKWQPEGLAVNPVPVLIMLAVVVAGSVILSRTVFGRRVYAIGGNETAATYAGVPVGRVKILAFAIMGALAGLSACVYLGYFGAAETNAGNGYELKVIAATVIGGASLSGGRGTALGAVLGAILIQLIDNGMVILRVDQNYNQIVMGASIVVAVVLDQLKTRLTSKSRT